MDDVRTVTWRGRLRWLAFVLRWWASWPWRQWVEPALAAWLGRWHGRGEEQQADYYRCHGCRRLVTWRAIRRGGCDCQLSHKLSPAPLRWWDKARLLLLPWTAVR